MNNYNKQVLDFWQNNDKVEHIIPPNAERRGIVFPEDWSVIETLHNTIGDHSVVEVGCGYGRLVKAFTPEQYTGFDINPHAVEKARKSNSDYNFNTYEPFQELPPSDWVLAYTVLLHVSDADILPMLETITRNCSKVFLAEIMVQVERKQPRPGKPPVFNRAPAIYENLFNRVGFHLVTHEKKGWYKNKKQIDIMTFERNE